jgi:HPt (histidine-containing phosphotransfer) domain-containing protein
MNLENLAQEVGLETDEFLEVAELYVEACASDFQKLQSAIDEQNAPRVAEAAHSIKGASANLGFTKAQAAAEKIETQARRDSLEGIAATASQLKKELDQVKILASK